MEKTLIRVDCVDQRLFVSSSPTIASGGRNEDEIEFNFCPMWDGFTKTAVFYRDTNAVYHSAITGNRCVIPHEVLADEGWMYFGVFGVKDDITRTSENMRYRVNKGAITESTAPSDPTPDIYEQILSRLASIERFTVPADPYSITGDIVTLDNFEGMPMNCVTLLKPVQTGSGEASPDNVRPITGHTGAKMTRSGEGLSETFSASFGQTVYGGTLDWNKGVLTVDIGTYAFTGDEDIGVANIAESDTVQQVNITGLPANMSTDDAICSEYAYNLAVTGGYSVGFRIYEPGFVVFGMPMEILRTYGADKGDESSLAPAAREYLVACQATGKPVQISYKLAEPYTIQLTPQSILALQGQNNIQSDAGQTTVSGRKDIIWMMSYLIERLNAHEAAIVSLKGNI